MSSPAAFKFIKVFDYDYAYLDSGAPASADYTTWVIFHGMGFNGAVFEKLFPLAHKHNLRIVSVYRRGYSPSSGFDEDELKGIGYGKKFDEAKSFLRGLGIEVATFLVKFATEQDIPLTDWDTRTGGIALIGWSLASIHILALLAFADELPEDSRSTLQKYLHTVLSHDASSLYFGIPGSDRLDTSLWSKSNDRERLDAFVYWVTGHYKHKSVTSGNIDDLEFNNPSDLPHSLHELSEEERGKYTSVEAFTTCDAKLLFVDTSVFVLLAKRALFDKARAQLLPNVRVRYMSSGTSSGTLIWALWPFGKYVENPEVFYGRDAEKVRDIKCVAQTEGNHFIFWDDPAKAIAQYGGSIAL